MDTAILFAGAPRFPALFDGGLLVLDSAEAACTAAGLADRLDQDWTRRARARAPASKGRSRPPSYRNSLR